MFKIVARLVCLVSAALALGSVAWTSAAFGQVPPPEPPLAPSGSAVAGGSSVADDIGWMLIGAGVLLGIAVLVTITVVAYQRHRSSGSTARLVGSASASA